MTLNLVAPVSQHNSPLLSHLRQLQQNETQSLQTASKDNAFIKTYSCGSTPEAPVHQQQQEAELKGQKSTNDRFVCYCVKRL